MTFEHNNIGLLPEMRVSTALRGIRVITKAIAPAMHRAVVRLKAPQVRNSDQPL